MRVLLLLLSSVVVSSCAQKSAGPIVPEPVRIPAEAFTCDPEPGAWPEGADDVEVAVNETIRTYAGRSCRQQLYTLCLVEKANGRVEGDCRVR